MDKQGSLLVAGRSEAEIPRDAGLLVAGRKSRLQRDWVLDTGY